MLAINFWVWFSVGPVGLRLTGPSAKLLITLIIFKFILDACYLYLQVNAWNCNQINATIVFIYPYLAAKTSVLKYVLHWPYVLSGCVIGIYSFRSSESFFQLDNTKHNLILILALKSILGKILLGISTPKLDIQDFVYISVICKATSVRSSVGLKYQLECDKVQQLQTHCGHALFFGGKSLYKDILFLCPQWGSGPYISRNFLIWTHFVNASWKKTEPTHAHCCYHFIHVTRQ